MDVYAWLLIIALICGTLGTFVPMVPGMWLVFVSLLVYGVFDHWHAYSPWFLLVVAVLAIISSTFDFGGSMLGAKKFGASGMSPMGTVIGGIVGGIFFSVPGGIIGGMLGAIIGEYYHKRDLQRALKAAAGSLIGTAIGSSVQLVIAIGITIYTIVRLWGAA